VLGPVKQNTRLPMDFYAAGTAS